MCDPISMTIAGLAIAGGAVSAGGQVYEGLNQAQGMRDQAKVGMQAANQSNIGIQQERERVGRERDQTIGAQRAAMAASGVDPNSQIGQTLEYDTALSAERDLSNLDMTARLKTQTAKIESDALRKNARRTVIGSAFGATGTMLGSAGKAAGAFT